MIKKLLLSLSISFILINSLKSKEIEEGTFENKIDTEFHYTKQSSHVVDVKLTASTITQFKTDKMKYILWQVLQNMILNVCIETSDIDKVELLDDLIIKKDNSLEKPYKYTQIMTVSCVKPIHKDYIY
jgi:hypothetical protein